MPNLSKESRILQLYPSELTIQHWVMAGVTKKDKVSQVPETMRSIDVGNGARTMVNGSD